MTKRVFSVLAALMFCLPVLASDVPAKIIGSWRGKWGNHEVSLVFSKTSFNLSAHDHEGELAKRVLYACEFSGTYQINQKDELIITTRAADLIKDYGATYSPKSCEHFPEITKDKELNIGTVEFITSSNKPDDMLVNSGRLLVTRQY